MNFIGYDIGSSSIKVSVVDEKGKLVAHTKYPETEMAIQSPEKGWAEQNPEDWWKVFCTVTQKILNENKINPHHIKGIGISYQMHGLVLVDENTNSIRNSIIWCDSRAVSIGNEAYNAIGPSQCMQELLNSPGNFTASKLKWVIDNEPENYSKTWKFMLPGDYIALKLTGEATTSITGLSESVLWDFEKEEISKTILNVYCIDADKVGRIVKNFENQAEVNEKGASECGLIIGTPIFYRAGDQPNNAFSLNVMQPGEIAATGGTSGVVYGVTDVIQSNEPVRINNFAHINHTTDKPRIGKMLCLNGAGIQYSWLRHQMDQQKHSYYELNLLAAQIPIGSDGLLIYPFGNGAERMLNNKDIGSSIHHLNFNRHQSAHFYRAGLEGIAYSFVYGMDILLADGLQRGTIKAGGDNLFRSPLFAQTIATLQETEIKIIDTTGSTGAARAAAIGAGAFASMDDILTTDDLITTYSPMLAQQNEYLESYQLWKEKLNQLLHIA